MNYVKIIQLENTIETEESDTDYKHGTKDIQVDMINIKEVYIVSIE